MGRKTYTIQSEINLQMICVPRCNLCPNDHVYLNFELFGETQRSKLMHPAFPLKTKENFYFTKTFWSPQNEKELHKLMRDSPVSIELRHLQSGSNDSHLLAFADSDSFKFLVEHAQSRIKDVITAERQINLTLTNHKCGQMPCAKMEVKTTISSSGTPIIDSLLDNEMDLCPFCDKFHLKKSQVLAGGCFVRSQSDMFNCSCELHRSTSGKMLHCSVCHQDCPRYPTRAAERRECSESEEEDIDDGPGRMRPPFVVRKVTTDLVGRKPDAYDSVYNGVMREQGQLRSSRTKKAHRLRSCSPKGDKRSSSRKSTEKNPEVCYACSLPPSEVRISCDSCNLTHRGEPSYRCGDLVRPEPPMLRTYRETVDQKPLYPISSFKCRKCIRKKVVKEGHDRDDPLIVSTRPLYKLDGYRDMAKYFSMEY